MLSHCVTDLEPNDQQPKEAEARVHRLRWAVPGCPAGKERRRRQSSGVMLRLEVSALSKVRVQSSEIREQRADDAELKLNQG